MSNILIWIDSSIRIKKKILILNQCLLRNFTKVLFVAQDKKTCKFYLRQGIDIICIEENIFIECNEKLIDYSSLLPTNINEPVLIEIIKLASYKSKNLYENFNNKYSDPYSQISLYQSFFRNVIDRHFITHSLILNGFSLSSFSLGIVSYKKNLNISFWENGLFPKSLFINKVGVNPFASSDFNSSMESNKKFFYLYMNLLKMNLLTTN